MYLQTYTTLFCSLFLRAGLQHLRTIVVRGQWLLYHSPSRFTNTTVLKEGLRSWYRNIVRSRVILTFPDNWISERDDAQSVGRITSHYYYCRKWKDGPLSAVCRYCAPLTQNRLHWPCAVCELLWAPLHHDAHVLHCWLWTFKCYLTKHFQCVR